MANQLDQWIAQEGDRDRIAGRVDKILANRGVDPSTVSDAKRGRIVDNVINQGAGYFDTIRAAPGRYQDRAGSGSSGGRGDGGSSGPSTEDLLEQERQRREQERQEDARERLNEFLGMYGLGGLASWAWDMIQRGHSFTTVLQELRTRPEYKQRFPAMDALRERGRAINESEYIGLERGYTKVARNYGLPKGFYDDPTDFSGWIANEMSTVELENRLRQWKKVAEEKAADPSNTSALQEMERLYGISADSGEWLALVIDPDKALPAIERQVEASRIGATSRNVGFGSLSRGEAERLAGATDVEGAREGLSTLSRSRELFNPLPGREQSERQFSRGDQFGAVFDGDTDQLRAIDRQARRRTAEFEGGGSFASSREGLSGLGRAR